MISCTYLLFLFQYMIDRVIISLDINHSLSSISSRSVKQEDGDEKCWENNWFLTKWHQIISLVRRF